ncbi:PIR protein [Plasmodium vivax]|uniref:VIR protein n=1 Tax=Plasmodium vivax TaxID=5855 RepID=A0A565A4L3_PLAVI|nr:PIR protein [Plasmodium vivax]
MASAGTEGDLGKNSIVLFSEKFYNDMNIEDNDLSDYSIYCDSIPWGKNGHEVKKICKKYITYLETSQILNVENPKYDVCILLNYWIYNELTKIFRDEQSLYLIERAFGSLQLVWNNLYLYSRTNHNKCDPKFESVNHKDWENRKKLYDYYVDYNTLKNMAEIFDGNCEYYKRINDMQTIFDYFDSLYATDPEKCPPIYNVCQSYNPKNMLSTLPCHKKLGQLSALPLARNPSEDDDITQSPEGPKPIHSVLGDGPAVETVTQIESGNSDIRTKVTNSVLGATPVLLTATALYRVCPWIRRLRGGRTNNMNAMDTFSPYTPKTGDMFSDESANYISYQPM